MLTSVDRRFVLSLCTSFLESVVVMDKTEYYDKMDALVNDKQTYEELKRRSL